MSEIKILRDGVMRAMREDFDPTPAGWEGRSWDDNAEDVADKILKLIALWVQGYLSNEEGNELAYALSCGAVGLKDGTEEKPK